MRTTANSMLIIVSGKEISNQQKKNKHIELWISARGEVLTVSLPAIWICHRAYSSILVLWSARRRRRRRRKNSLNLIHGQSHHSYGHIWIRCLDIQFAKGLLCFVAEGFRAALILCQNDRVPERIQMNASVNGYDLEGFPGNGWLRSCKASKGKEKQHL